MTKWLTHWSLREAPFTKEFGDADLWVPSSHIGAIDRLVDACRDHGHALLVGEPGVGKTCILRALRHRLPQDGFRLTYCHNATLGRRDFYRHVCLALSLSPSATAAAVFYAISTHVNELGNDKIHPVFFNRRGPPTPPRRARALAHPGELRVGLEGVAIDHSRGAAGDETTACPREEPLALVADPRATVARRRQARRHGGVRDASASACGLRTAALQLRRARPTARTVAGAPPRHRSTRHRCPQSGLRETRSRPSTASSSRTSLVTPSSSPTTDINELNGSAQP